MAVYHTDIPDPRHPSPYDPPSLTLLSYIATTLLTLHSLPNLLATRAAEARSLPRPTFGLTEEIEGVIIGLPPASITSTITPETAGVVIEMEHRRKSGRGVREWYFLPSSPPANRLWTPQTPQRENVVLLDDHPLFGKFSAVEGEKMGDGGGEGMTEGLTFDLKLTERQRREREGVVLPYFDAQKEGGATGPGEGGRILYDMGVEDDFDEEEDEI